jgi:hypothetical protein
MIEASGRDKHIVLTALAYAVAAIEQLPARRQAGSDLVDMKRMLEEMAPSDVELEMYAGSARRHLVPDLPS